MKLKDGKIIEEKIIEEINFEEEQDIKIYCLNDKEGLDYIINKTNGLAGIDLNDVKQIETDYWNNVYVLTNDKKLYFNSLCICSDINRLYLFDGFHIYIIQEDNTIIPTGDAKEWDNLDMYLYNDGIAYKKIIEDTLMITALTEDKRVISVSFSINQGIVPENFIDVDDIYYEDNEIFIIKNGQSKPLYIK